MPTYMEIAKSELRELYDHEDWFRRGAKCPIDGSAMFVAWHTHKGARAGYLKCTKSGHYIRWTCCGKRKRVKNRRR